MGMNPETHQFEELSTPELLKAAGIKGWKIFTIGERVTVGGVDFRVEDISPTKLILRPYGLTQLKRGDART